MATTNGGGADAGGLGEPGAVGTSVGQAGPGSPPDGGTVGNSVGQAGPGSPPDAGTVGNSVGQAAARGAEVTAGPGYGPGTRASDRERDAVVLRVQQAFAEGRLNDVEFDERMRAALVARTHADLDVLLTDLPATAPGPAPAVVGRGPGRVAIALKGSVRRGGRWRVPERYTTVVYKGDGRLDLRAAELSGPVTTFLAVAYKSTVTILVPRSVRVEMTGFGVTQGLADTEDLGYQLPADAPVIHVRGVAYKGAVEITTRPPERRALGSQ